MRKVLLLIGAIGVLSVSSCSNGGTSDSNGNEAESSRSEKSGGASKNELKSADCLEKFNHDYAKMLTLDDIALHQEIDQSAVETDIPSTKGEYGKVNYTWASDRPDQEIEIMGHKIKGPDQNHVELKMMSFYDDGTAETIEYFERGYKKLSEEELAQIYANLEKTYVNKSEELEQAKGFMEARKTSNYVEVQDLGTRSYWKWDERYGGELVTLVGRAKFTVAAKISSDPDANLAFAKKLAQEVINKCN